MKLRIAIVLALCFFLSIGSAEELSNRLSDDAFWKLVTDFSEPSGKFPSDNFTSNELAIQKILPELVKGRKAGGAYLGVGPEQNFTYIVALKPKIAFIIDIRRQNMIEHLMYKALIETAADRAEFLSHLFSRPRPADIGKASTVTALFEAYRDVDAVQKLYEDTLLAVRTHLMKDHGFTLTPDDENVIAYILREFALGGPKLGYGGPPQALNPVQRILPTFDELMVDTDQDGVQQSFLATEDHFLTLQEFEKNNLIVPIVGDFAGPGAFHAVGDYLKKHGAVVSALYTSNVEQYLFMSDDWKAFYKNVATLPLDSKSVFIRPLINTGDVRVGPGPYSASPAFRTGFHFDTMLFPIRDLITAFDGGMIQNYYDAIAIHN
jgi:hypothetical protein